MAHTSRHVAEIVAFITVALLAAACASARPSAVLQPARRNSCNASGADTLPVYPEALINPRPEPIGYKPPKTPRELLDIWQPQSAAVEFVVDTLGRAEPCTVRLVRTSNHAWGDAIQKWARTLTFEPIRLEGKKVRVRFHVPLEWQPVR